MGQNIERKVSWRNLEYFLRTFGCMAQHDLRLVVDLETAWRRYEPKISISAFRHCPGFDCQVRRDLQSFRYNSLSRKLLCLNVEHERSFPLYPVTQNGLHRIF